LAEEEIRVELASLSETVDAHKKLLGDELVDKVGASIIFRTSLETFRFLTILPSFV
jgi:hypothetical protein